jgi:outer membrane lipoprotein-sorting protein
MKKSDLAVSTFLFLIGSIGYGGGSEATKEETIKIAAGVPAIGPATKGQLATLEKFQKRLTGAGQVSAKIHRKTVIGLLGQEKQAEGNLQVSKGRVRLDLKTAETDERHLLVVGAKAFWAVTYPSKDLEGALVQVVTGPVKSKKAGSAGFLAILGKDGFLKSFSVTGVTLDKDGGIRYYLQPKADWVEAKRALLALGPELSKSKKTSVRDFREIKIWDFQDNETQFTLEKVKFESTAVADSKFEFSPPKNADVMSVAQ